MRDRYLKVQMQMCAKTGSNCTHSHSPDKVETLNTLPNVNSNKHTEQDEPAKEDHAGHGHDVNKAKVTFINVVTN